MWKIDKNQPFFFCPLVIIFLVALSWVIYAVVSQESNHGCHGNNVNKAHCNHDENFKPLSSKSNSIPDRPIRNVGSRSIKEFSWNLFKNSKSEKNFVLSPVTPLILLTYLAYVAEGNTRKELIKAIEFGDPKSLYRFVDQLQKKNSDREFSIATAFFVSQKVQ